MNTTEFSAVTECCTAAMTSHTTTGENYDGPICVGIYTGTGSEVWLEFKGVRANIAIEDVPELCRQIKRAAKIAGEKNDRAND